MLRSSRLARTLALALLAGTGCRSHDPATELTVSGIQTYWIVDSPQDGENYIAPAVRFQLRNVGSEPLSSVQARARFPAPGQSEVWGSIQEQVSHWRRPLKPGEERLVTVRGAGRYHARAEPEDMLRSPEFQDPRVEVFVRIGGSHWAKLAETRVERRIGAPGTLTLEGR